MYIIIKKYPFKVTTFETKTDLATYLGVHRNTITNNFKEDEYWWTEKGIVYQSNKHYKRLRKGNKDSFVLKQAKKQSDWSEHQE